MLFSNDDIATYINDNFEPAWMMVRPVPMVRIDFGDRTVTRTLHGNIATYVCTADGTTLDIMPGVYEPSTYFDRLRQFSLLHRWATTSRNTAETLRTYHVTQRNAIEAGEQPHELHVQDRKQPSVADFSKVVRIERPVELVLQPRAEVKRREMPAVDKRFDMLKEDTRINESVRRLRIHEKLADAGPLKPPAITKWLYREVLNADLDDPYVGLGKLLFDDYPFAAEEIAAQPPSGRRTND